MYYGVKGLKKYLYISILFGAFALSGCADEGTDNKKNTEEISPSLLNLTQEQKEDYYQKYLALIENINSEHDTGLMLEPITSFSEDYWVEVETFKKRANERADISIVVSKNKERYHPASVPKTVTLEIGPNKERIIFEGSFDTQLNENTSKGRQLFSVFNGISSEAENSDGSWTQIGYTNSLMENGSIYVIDVSGNYSQNGILSTHNISLEFDCNKNGGIS